MNRYLTALPAMVLAVLLSCAGPFSRAQDTAAGHGSGHSSAHASAHDANAEATASPFDRDTALQTSQAAIGREVADHGFYDTKGQRRTLADYRGKPLVISLIYTSCYHICPTTTQHLAKVVANARSVLGVDSFAVVTVGFDTANDTADAMRHFSEQQQVDDPNWDFLATDEAAVQGLAADLGFQFYPSAAGFDHLIQTSMLDANGLVNRQVYGMDFDTPHLVEPLKALVFGEDLSHSFFDQLSNKVRLFCTVYDPASDSYLFDYSIFVGLTIGLVLGGFFVYLLIREWRFSSKARKAAESLTGAVE